MVTGAKLNELLGNTTEAYGANPGDLDKIYKFRYKIVDIDNLIPSHTDTLTPNPHYPQELQPRLRDRAASRAQIDNMAQNLNPRVLLTDTGMLDTGPMIVGSDDVVESGNGRVLALRKAAGEDSSRWELYKNMLTSNSSKYGIPVEEVERIPHPVLVRERETPVDRVQFAQEANQAAVMGMSPFEQALVDSKRLSSSVLDTLSVGEDQTIDQALRARANDHIVNHFLQTVPPNERAALADSSGQINQQGLQRLKMAIFAKTYPDESGKRLTRTFSESVDPLIKNVENGMFQSLPDMAKAEAMINSGDREANLEMTTDLAIAIDTYARLKQTNLKVQDYLKQSHMFGDELTPFQSQILDHLDTIGQRPKLIREFLRESAEKIVEAPPKGQEGMLGMAPPSKEELVNGIINRQRNELGKESLPIATVTAGDPRLEKSDTEGDTSTSRVGPEIQNADSGNKSPDTMKQPASNKEGEKMDTTTNDLEEKLRKMRELRQKSQGLNETPLTTEQTSNIMTNEVKEAQSERPGDLSPGRASDVFGQRPDEQGAALSERQQSAGIPVIGQEPEARKVSEIRSEDLPPGSGVVDATGSIERRSMADGNQSGDIRGENRLTEPSQTPVNEPAIPPKSAARDIKLDDLDIGFDAGAAARFDANMAAIRTLKEIEDEHRNATTEEQLTLAKYSGFGDSAFGEAFPGYEPNERYSHLTPWLRRRKELKALTTVEEFKAIEGSRLNAFYTTPQVIKAMWNGLDRLGVGKLPNIRVLEPSAGSGRFLGYEPAELKAKSERTAVELDSLTGRILKQLYPEAATFVMGFERAPIGKETIDVAISNVPFGSYPIFDPTFKKDRKKLTRSIHNYFFAKTMEELRPGGVLAFITTHQTLDAKTTRPVREYLASQADLLGAIRLPKNAFPDTDVCTDIIFMRKRMPNEGPGDKSWVDTQDQHFKWTDKYEDQLESDLSVNKYFIEHPEMVMGTPAATGSMNPHNLSEGEYTVEPIPGLNLEERMNDAMKKLPENVVTEAPRHAVLQTVYGDSASTPLSTREGSHIVREDGHIYVKRNGALEPANLTDSEETRVKKMLEIRDLAKNLVDMQVRDRPDSELIPSQERLRSLYKEYVLENGPFSVPSNADLLDKDPDEPFLQALENHNLLDKDKKDLTADDQRMVKVLKGKDKAQESDIDKLEMPIFKKRVIHGMEDHPVTDYSDAISMSRNVAGRLDFDFISDKMGKSRDEVIRNLRERNLIYKNPVGDWEPEDEYLSGDVRLKLRQAIDAASARPNEYKRNVEALKTVQPADIPPGQISARMGATWIPADDINHFVKQMLNAGSNDRYSWRQVEEEELSDKDQYFFYRPLTGSWVINHKPNADEAMLKSEYGTARIDATHIVERILNGQLVEVNDKMTGDDGKEHTVRNQTETIAAQEKANVIQRKWEEWIWSDPDRAQRLAKVYNETFNNYHPRVYDGAHLVMPGIAEKWSKFMHTHQRDAIWRVIQDRTALLAHEVGFGKTAVMVGSGMELKRLGLASKIVYVVPKATHAQFKQQFEDIYPYSKILYPSEDDFSEQKRPEFISRAITGDWDAIILSDSQFRRIPVRPETEAKFVQDEIDAMMEALHDTDDKRTQKEIEAQIKRMTVKLQNLSARAAEVADQTVYFEDMGIDQIYVDEADNFKNLHFATKMGRIKGLPNSESDRAWDMYEKIRCLQDRDKKAGIVFATGTPIANTIAEMYTMMRYLQEPMLEEKGMQHFDAWAKTFGQSTESIEQTPTGLYRMTQRFAKFNNAPELSNMWQGVADIRVADEVLEMTRVRPRIVDENGKSKRMVISVEPDQALVDYMKLLAERADNLKNVTPEEDNMLRISSDARKASLDMHLVNAEAPENPNSKVGACVDKVIQIYKETTPDKGTQMIFLDMGTPKAKDKTDDGDQPAEDIEEDTKEEAQLLTDVYSKIKKQLVAGGIPAEQIAFVHEANTDQKKRTMQARINSGDIRVIIGSTAKLGTGTNIQQRAAALHHLDAPWRPRDIEQREGRIVRQGNVVYGPKIDAEGKVTDPGKGVRIYTYVTERSFDAYMWQAIEAKSKAIKAIMRRSAPPRSVEDVDSFTMSASEAKALASGNPDVLKEVTLKNNITRFQMLRSSFVDQQVRARTKVKALPLEITVTTEDKAKLEKDSRQIQDLGDKFTIKVNGVEMKERADAGNAIVDLVKKGQTFGQEIADYRGFKVKVIDNGPSLGYALIVRNPETGNEYGNKNIFPYGDLNPTGVMSRIDHRIDGIKYDLKKTTDNLEGLQKSLKSYEVQADKTFEYQDRLDRMQKELDRLEKKLQGQEVTEPEASSELYTADIPEDSEPAYHWTSKKDEVVNPKAEIAAMKAEVAPVEKELEVKAPPANIENVVEKMAEPVKEPPKPDLGKIGDKINIMGVDSNLTDSKTTDNVRFDLFTSDTKAAIRVVDVDSGEILSMKQYPDQEAALNSFSKTTTLANKIAEPAKETEKAPWQMTKEEFEQANYDGENVTGWDDSPEKVQADKLLQESEPLTNGTSKEDKEKGQELVNAAQAIADEYYEKHNHKTQIAEALRQNKPVPAEVLADYPGLKESLAKKEEEPVYPQVKELEESSIVHQPSLKADLKRLKEIRQAKDMAYDMAINDHGAALQKLEEEEKQVLAKLNQTKVMVDREVKLPPLMAPEIEAMRKKVTYKLPLTDTAGENFIVESIDTTGGYGADWVYHLRKVSDGSGREIKLSNIPEFFKTPPEEPKALVDEVTKNLSHADAIRAIAASTIEKKGEALDELKTRYANESEKQEYKPNKYYVYEGDILRAAQSTKEGAKKYMQPGRELLTEPKKTNLETKEKPESEKQAYLIDTVRSVNMKEQERLSAKGGTGKMVLFPKDLAAQFPKTYSTEKVPETDKVVIAKFFHPLSHQTWYAVEYNPQDREFFGYVDTGDQDSEWGYFSLDEIQDTAKGGLHFERDLYFTPEKISELPGLKDRFGPERVEPPTPEPDIVAEHVMVPAEKPFTETPVSDTKPAEIVSKPAETVTKEPEPDTEAALSAEAKTALDEYIRNHGKSPFSEGREGKLYLVDGTPHVLLEDNGDRALFQAVGKTVGNLEIKPTTVATLDDAKEMPIKVEPSGPTLGTVEKQPWETTRAAFEAHYPKLQDMPADKQHEVLDKINAASSEVEGAEPLAFEQFITDFHDMRFDPETGEITMQPEHEDFVIEAFNNHYDIPDEVRTEYKEKLAELQAKREASSEKRRKQRTPKATSEPEKPPLTAKLNNGDIVLAKLYEGQASAITYANRTQAEKAADKVGGTVIQRGRPFFVQMPAPTPPAEPGTEHPEEMTQADYVKYREGKPMFAGVFETKNIHKNEVERALKEDRTVKPEVLADYPDLEDLQHNIEANASGQDILAEGHQRALEAEEESKNPEAIAVGRSRYIEKRLKEIQQAKDLAKDSAIYDKGESLRALEAEEKTLEAELHPQPKDVEAFGNKLKEPEGGPYSGPSAATMEKLALTFPPAEPEQFNEYRASYTSSEGGEPETVYQKIVAKDMDSALEIARKLAADIGTLHGVSLQFEGKVKPTVVFPEPVDNVINSFTDANEKAYAEEYAKWIKDGRIDEMPRHERLLSAVQSSGIIDKVSKAYAAFEPKALPVMCDHRQLIQYCYSVYPGRWSPAFQNVCKNCGEWEKSEWPQILTRQNTNARMIVDNRNGPPPGWKPPEELKTPELPAATIETMAGAPKAKRLTVVAGDKTYEADSLRDASDKYRTVIKAATIGASEKEKPEETTKVQVVQPSMMPEHHHHKVSPAQGQLAFDWNAEKANLETVPLVFATVSNQEMQSSKAAAKPNTATTALAVVPASELSTADTEPTASRISGRQATGMTLTAGKLPQPPSGGITGNGKQLPPLNATKEGKIYKIKGSGLTRSLKRGRLVNET